MVRFFDPADIHPPVGNHSPTALVPQGTELLFVFGQVRMRPDGAVPEVFAEQAELVFRNLRAGLALLLEVEAVAVKTPAAGARAAVEL